MNCKGLKIRIYTYIFWTGYIAMLVMACLPVGGNLSSKKLAHTIRLDYFLHLVVYFLICLYFLFGQWKGLALFDKKPLCKFIAVTLVLAIFTEVVFRIVPQSNEPNIIREIQTLGHEIGYHYEDLTLCKGNPDKAIKSFERNLNYFRQFGPVKTICMHGSPLSRFDNRKLWEKYNYRDFGITGEPYFDIDFAKVLYLTDTGRRWDGEKMSIRDK